MSSGYVSTHQRNMIVARSRRSVHCFESGPALPFGYCATYSESNSLSIAKCPYFEWSKYNVTTPGYISLPVLLTELNNYMCGPLNRKGSVSVQIILVPQSIPMDQPTNVPTVLMLGTTYYLSSLLSLSQPHFFFLSF